MIVAEVRVRPHEPGPGWRFDLAPVRVLVRTGLRFPGPVTFFAGPNGSGKSTLAEAIAEACGVGAEVATPGGATPPPSSPVHWDPPWNCSPRPAFGSEEAGVGSVLF